MNVIAQYLQRYAEPIADTCAEALAQHHWRQALVIPAYKEAPELIDHLHTLTQPASGVVVILVLNQPQDSGEADPNAALRHRIQSLPLAAGMEPRPSNLFKLSHDSHLLLLEPEQPLSKRQGVGMARKIGLDLALALHQRGQITSPWLLTSDADAQWPATYLSQTAAAEPSAAALLWPYRHQRPTDQSQREAMIVYELSLHWYVTQLHGAGSPYAFHTVGSCIAVNCTHYAQVRGMPKRAGGEDFHLLAKLAKVGPILQLTQDPILLSARASNRVPFGTGPAVRALRDNPERFAQPLFQHPHSFTRLQQLFEVIPDLYGQADALNGLQQALNDPVLFQVLQQLGISKALRHCRDQSPGATQFLAHFHQWFDALRTLQCVHGLRDADSANLSFEQLPGSNNSAATMEARAEFMLRQLLRQQGWMP